MSGIRSGEVITATASACKFSVLGHSGARHGEGCAGCDEQHLHLVEKHIGDRDIKPENVPKMSVRDAFLAAADAIDPLPDVERQRVLRALAAIYPPSGGK